MLARNALVALVTIGSVACTTTHHRVLASGQDLHARASELNMTGQARVPAQDGGRIVTQYPVRRDQLVIVDGERRVLGDLFAGCDPSAAGERTADPSRCEILRRSEELIVLRDEHTRRVSWTAVGLTGTLLVTAGITSWGICYGARCNGSPTIDRTTEIAGVTSLVVVSGALAYLLVGCLIAGACTR